MKTKTQKRLEAANRLDRLAGDIDAGRSWVWSAPEDRFRDAQKRRDEAKRLRDMSGTR